MNKRAWGARSAFAAALIGAPIAAWMATSTVGLAVIAGVVCLAIVCALRLTALELIIVLSPLMFYAPFAGGELNVSIADFVLPACFVAMLIERRRNASMAAHRIVVIHVFAVLFALLLSLTVAASQGRLFSLTAGVVSVSKWAIVMSYLLVAGWSAKSSIFRGDFRFLKVWSIAAAIIAAMSTLNAFGILPLGRQFGESGRYSGTFEDPNLFGAYLLLSLAVVTAARSRAGLRFVWAHYGVLTLAAVMTASRATYAGLAILVLLTVTFGSGVRQRLRAMLLLIAAGGGIWMFSGGVSGVSVIDAAIERVLERGAVAGSDIRITFWSLAYEKWLEYPTTGLGPGQFLYASGSIFSTVSGGVAHNTYLEVLSELGVVGASAFILLAISVLWFAIRVRSRDRVISTFAIVGMGGIAVEMGSLSLQNARFIWVFLGLLMAVLTFEVEPAVKEGRLSDHATR